MRIFSSGGKISEDAQDVLYEMGNMGVGTATIQLGEVRQMKIMLDSPKVIAMDEDVFASMEIPNDQVPLGVILKMQGHYGGSMLFMLSTEFIENTVYDMLGERIERDQLLVNEDSFSAIEELVNMMSASYSKMIGSYLEQPIYISPVMLGMENAKELFAMALKESDRETDKIASVHMGFSLINENGEKTNESAQIIICPDENLIKKFVEIMNG